MSPDKHILHEIRFDYLPKSPLQNGWVKPFPEDATPQFQSAPEIPNGLCIQSDGRVYAIDYVIPPEGNPASRIMFDAQFFQEARLYTLIEVTKALGSSDTEECWFKHLLGDGQPPIRLPGNEWMFYVSPKNGKKQFEIDLLEEIAEVLPSGKSFIGIKRIRLRGDISLSPIRLSQVSVPAKTPHGESAPTESAKRFLQPWKSWARADKLALVIGLPTVLLAVAAIVVAVYLPELRIYLGLDKPKIEGKSGRPEEKVLPEPKPLIAETAASVEEMRRRHHVTLIPTTEAQKNVGEVQPSSWGYAYPSKIIYEPTNKIQIQVRDMRDLFEIHKLDDGSILVVGYVGPETVIRLREGLKTNADFTLYSGMMKEASDLVALPLNRLKCPRDRQLPTSTALDCKVTE